MAKALASGSFGARALKGRSPGVMTGGLGWQLANAAQLLQSAHWSEAVIKQPPDGAGIDIVSPPRLPILRELPGKRSKATTNFHAKRPAVAAPLTADWSPTPCPSKTPALSP
ncbi:hypothetical protein BQ8794_180164 [Mesorhizobium prunaredense]|uniref:Uncharacterized protein n=1 Tax=Mesorhizobium prunaredense TaxID=1631249 RepID=A0A1R3V4S0_9HYPH|nr:hypothetical protein BQ8794_180164 [Mesorhizobium prunaredense]